MFMTILVLVTVEVVVAMIFIGGPVCLRFPTSHGTYLRTCSLEEKVSFSDLYWFQFYRTYFSEPAQEISLILQHFNSKLKNSTHDI